MLFNSLTRRVERFVPVHPGEARVYTCGPTVYNYAHIGNMRAYVFADVLGRALSAHGYALNHVINITDVGHLTDDADAGEDKLERAARAGGASIEEIARYYTAAFRADVAALNIRAPATWSIATQYVPRMIEFARAIAPAHCYVLATGLYFDVTSVADYGRLARGVNEEGGQGEQGGEGEGRIDPVAGKRHPADFAIWRRTPEGESRAMEWDSPWGRGAPGWHLECSVMSGALLGFPFDIHTGGIDHREIHHPNEIAQNQAFCGCGSLDVASHSGANVWMHNNFLVVRDEARTAKMAKSSGEFLRLGRLVDRGYHPLAYRLMCLQAHYRSELEFSWPGLGAALTRLKRLVIAAERLRVVEAPAEAPAQAPPGAGAAGTVDHPRLAPLLAAFAAAIADDLNTPLALTLFEEALAVKKVDPATLRAALARMDAVLGFGVLDLARADLRLRPLAATVSDEAIADLLTRRRDARADKDFAAADLLRDQLARHGIEVMDGDSLEWDWRLPREDAGLGRLGATPA